MRIYDISMPLREDTPCWPGKKVLKVTTTRRISDGDECDCHSFSMDVHLGTHMDAPSHFLVNGATVDQIRLATAIGQCRVIEYNGPLGSEIPPHIITENWPERILFKTVNSSLLSRPEFNPQFVPLSRDLAHSLANNAVKLVGIDYFSVDSFDSRNRDVHRILLGAGILILEGLDLSQIKAGNYQLVAIPLKLVGLEGSPVRAVLLS